MVEGREVTLVLDGTPLAGYNGKLGDYLFNNGRCKVVGSPKELDGVIKYMMSCYQAKPEGCNWRETPSIAETTLILTGSMKGQNIKLNGYNFNGGRLELKGSFDEVDGICRYFGRSYQAFPEGSKELKEAQRGCGEIQASPVEDGQQKVQSEPKQIEPTVDTQKADDGAGTDETAEGESRSTPTGDGESAGSAPDPTARLRQVKAAVCNLDPEEESHWTQEGKPSVFALRPLLGEEDKVTRAEIDEYMPRFDREFAQDIKNHAKQ